MEGMAVEGMAVEGMAVEGMVVVGTGPDSAVDREPCLPPGMAAATILPLCTC